MALFEDANQRRVGPRRSGGKQSKGCQQGESTQQYHATNFTRAAPSAFAKVRDIRNLKGLRPPGRLPEKMPMPGCNLSFETANPIADPVLGVAIRHQSPTAVVRATLAALIFLSTPAWASETEAERALAVFAKSARIDFWPALRLCGYVEAFGDRRAGLWLKVIDRENAQARWDGACHVPANHRISAWPAELPPGEYIVAVTADTLRNERFPKGNRHLRIEAVLALAAVDREQLFHALIDRVCAGQESPPADRTCRERPAAGQAVAGSGPG